MRPKSHTSKFRFKSEGLGTFGSIVIALCVLLIAAMAAWRYGNRERLARTFNVRVEFLLAPDTTRAGSAARFIVHVRGEDGKEAMPRRILNFAVSPPERARILSVSGASGTDYAKTGPRAQGRTDSEGNVTVMLEAAEPGKYTLVALDSASEREGTVNFRALPPEG